jgi:hypothetical protein
LLRFKQQKKIGEMNLVKTKSLEATLEKWQRRVGQAGPDYTAGVNDPKADWATETKAAEPRYKEGVIRAANEGRFGKGVSAAGTEKWKRGATTKGVERWPTGVAAAGPEYSNGMGKVLSAIGSASLPPRYPAGDERNLQRVAAMNKAVHNATKGK